ncbi:hypothetical protein T11_9403 [Trichinella zimbabwensis]|uniref:Uncharacterized protein n=1 Tax=Trichinella zimbabwensis TaxID=268475 RepID=A0A0V1GTP2_9BILA|nr:hypothetical protein T11_9403 [Trichinella zimbabwensis]
MAFLNAPADSSVLEVQILMLLITFAATIALLLLCGWCSKRDDDENRQATSPESVQPMYPGFPPVQPYSQQMGAQAFMPMAVPNYTAGLPPTILTGFPVPPPAAPAAPPPAPAASAEPEDGVDPAMEDMAKGQSARDTMADVPSIKEHLSPKGKPF